MPALREPEHERYPHPAEVAMDEIGRETSEHGVDAVGSRSVQCLEVVTCGAVQLDGLGEGPLARELPPEAHDVVVEGRHRFEPADHVVGERLGGH